MKLLLIAVSILHCGFSVAGEYRYNLMATTGLQEQVFDVKGKATTIIFSPKSDPKAQFLLTKLLELGGINGTAKKLTSRGIAYDQAILLRGKLGPKIHKTSSGPGLPSAEEYQEFVLVEVFVRFPLSRWREGKVFDSGFLETHFNFDTLFPDGLSYKGNKIELYKHIKQSEQGAASDR